MSENDKAAFLQRWGTEPAKEEWSTTPPEGFSQRMQQRALNAWGVMLDLETPISLDIKSSEGFSGERTLSSSDSRLSQEDLDLRDSVVVSLAEWKKRHLVPKDKSGTKLRAGSMDAPPLLAVGHGSSEGESVYKEGELLTLDIKSVKEQPLYITVLFFRENEQFQLIYPFGPEDSYIPMKRLELEWEVEPGGGHRSFWTLFSHRPLFQPTNLESDSDNAWSKESVYKVLRTIPWNDVIHIDEMDFSVS